MHITLPHQSIVCRGLFLGLLLVTMSPRDAWPQMKPAQPTSRLSATLQPFVENHSLAGAVALVATKDKVLAIETVGFADIAARKPMKSDTLFWIASQSKPMTAAALMMLVDEGKVSLEETTVTQLRYPLSNRGNRYPMPAGGLFSTASDTARFCQMILNGERKVIRRIGEPCVAEVAGVRRVRDPARAGAPRRNA